MTDRADGAGLTGSNPAYPVARERSKASMIHAADNDCGAGSPLQLCIIRQGAQCPGQLTRAFCARAPAAPRQRLGEYTRHVLVGVYLAHLDAS
eukprot:5044895-Pleurochrysis_carterae.AAC.1